MTPLCSRSCLQLALAAAVYILLGLPPSSTQECRLELTERLKKRSVTFRNIDIKLCQVICQDDFIFASCRQLKMIEKTGGSSVRPENHPFVKTKSCTSKVCNPRTSGGLQTEPRKAVAVQCHAASSTLESRCKRDSDCPAARKFVCYTKRCKCEPGYSFNPANNSCVRRCKTYGDRFTRYRGLGIKYNNERVERSKTVEGCSIRCIRQETFLCLTYECSLDSKGRNCYLSKSGYLDVSSSMRVVGQDDWMLFVRNCA